MLRFKNMLESRDTGTAKKLLKKLHSSTTKAGQTADYTATCLDHSCVAVVGHTMERIVPSEQQFISLWPQGPGSKMVDNTLESSMEIAHRPKARGLCDRAGSGGMVCGLLEQKCRFVASYDPLHDAWNQTQLGSQVQTEVGHRCLQHDGLPVPK